MKWSYFSNNNVELVLKLIKLAPYFLKPYSNIGIF